MVRPHSHYTQTTCRTENFKKLSFSLLIDIFFGMQWRPENDPLHNIKMSINRGLRIYFGMLYLLMDSNVRVGLISKPSKPSKPHGLTWHLYIWHLNISKWFSALSFPSLHHIHNYIFKITWLLLKTGHDQIIILTVDAFDTIKNVKALIEHKVDVPISEQEFVFANKSLENLFSLAEYKICKLNTINLIWKHDGNIKIFVKNFLRKQLYFQGLETNIYFI